MNISMIRGDSRTFAFVLTDAGGTPLDLTGAIGITMTAKAYYTDSDGSATFQKTVGDGITVLDDANGLISVALEPDDTDSLSATRVRLVYDIQVQDSLNAVTTAVRGRLTVLPDVTTTVEAS